MLFKIALAMIFGILIQHNIDINFIAFAVIIIILAFHPLQKIFKNLKVQYIWVFTAFAVGCFLSAFAQRYEMNGLYPVDDKFITAYGYVCEIPDQNEDRYSYIIKIEKAEYIKDGYHVNENVLLSSDVKLEYTQNVKIRGFLERISGQKNRSDYDYNLYYKSKDVFYRIDDYEIIPADYRKLYGIKHFSNLMRLKVGAVADRYFESEQAALLKAITVGNKKDFSEDFSDILYKTNIMRMLYPGYLHVLLITGILNIILMFFRKERRDLFIIFALIIYSAFNYESAVLLKLALLLITTIIALRRYGYAHYPDIASGVIIGILIFNPLLVYNSGFVISIVMGWMFFMIKEPVTKAFGFIKISWIKHLIVLTFLSVVGVFPLASYYFYGISILGTPLTYICFPLVAAVIISFPLFVLELVILGQSFVIKYIIGAILLFFNKLPYWIDKIPFSNISTGKPSILLVIVFYLMVVFIRYMYINGWKNIKTKLTAFLIIGFCISLIGNEIYMGRAAYFTFVNVGQGDGAFIRTSKNETIVVDGGGAEEFSDYDAGKKVFLPYLKSEGIINVDLAIVTHYHKDHCLGTIAMLENLNVQAVAMPDCSYGNEYREKIEALADEKGTEIIYLKNGDRITMDSGTVIDVISAGTGDFENENDTSIVFKLTYKNFEALYMGDATKNIEHEFLEKFDDVDLIKIGHHGSATSTSQEFLEVIKPEIAVISVGEDNVYNLPNDEVIERIKDSGAYIYRTDEMGDITFAVFDRENILVNYFYKDSRNNEWRK